MENLVSGTYVRNVEGSTICVPKGYRSWKQFYKSNASWPASLTCRIYDCGSKARVGAHVQISGLIGIYIIPMCARHNNFSRVDWMTVNANTVAVPVTQKHTSGRFGVCYT